VEAKIQLKLGLKNKKVVKEFSAHKEDAASIGKTSEAKLSNKK